MVARKGTAWKGRSDAVKTAVTATSIDAYYNEIRCGREGTQRRHIFEWIRAFKAPVTRQQIQAATGYPINVVTARVNALIQSGALERGVEVYTDEHGQPCNARETVMVKPQTELSFSYELPHSHARAPTP